MNEHYEVELTEFAEGGGGNLRGLIGMGDRDLDTGRHGATLTGGVRCISVGRRGAAGPSDFDVRGTFYSPRCHGTEAAHLVSEVTTNVVLTLYREIK